MKTKLAIPLLSVLAGVASVSVGTAGAADTAVRPTLVIRHQVHGCHAWSLNGNAYKPSQVLTIHRGAFLAITNNDVMPHKLVETRGPAVAITRVSAGMPGKGMGLTGTFPPAMMARMSAVVKVTFTKPGVYTFITKPGEDYMSGMKTIGADNVLRLTVTVN